MRTFKDTAARQWTVKLDIPLIAAVRKAHGVNLANLRELIEKLAPDVVVLVAVLWMSIESQATEAGVTEEQFGRSLTGQELQDGFYALLHATADFMPVQSRAPALAFVAQTRKATDRVAHLAGETLADPAWADRLVAQLQAALKAEATPQPE